MTFAGGDCAYLYPKVSGMQKIFGTVFIFLVVTLAAHAQQEVFVKNEEAIRGYDPVAYFTESKPVKGKKEFSYTWKDARWLFSSRQNLETFKADPEQYAPQFGGYCAYGVSDGHKAPTSPEAWTIVEGKLYLNYNTDVQVLWKEKQAEHIERANINWPVVKKEKD